MDTGTLKSRWRRFRKAWRNEESCESIAAQSAPPFSDHLPFGLTSSHQAVDLIFTCGRFRTCRYQRMRRGPCWRGCVRRPRGQRYVRRLPDHSYFRLIAGAPYQPSATHRQSLWYIQSMASPKMSLAYMGTPYHHPRARMWLSECSRLQSTPPMSTKSRGSIRPNPR